MEAGSARQGTKMAKRSSEPAGKARKPDAVNGSSLSPQKLALECCCRGELAELIKSRFPEVFVEGKIDGDRLKRSLGEDLDNNNERYGLSWAGKADLGFKVFRLEESNFKQWRENMKEPTEFKRQLWEMVDNVKKGAAGEDMLFEIILKNSRFDLNVKVEKETFDGADYYLLTTEGLARLRFAQPQPNPKH